MPRPLRIGVLLPSTNTVVEADFQRLGQIGISVHGHRLRIPDGELTEDCLDQMNADLDQAIETLATAHVDIMVYACTSGSFYKGAGWDTDVLSRIERKGGVPGVATSPAVTAALNHLGGGAISVVTPYPDWTNRRLAAYFSQQGFTVLGVAGDARATEGGHSHINDQEPERIAAFGGDHCDAAARILFCSCTAWRSFEAVNALETKLERPVVTANQATIWATLRTLGAQGPVRNAGRLFEA
jgi:maleate isomerase